MTDFDNVFLNGSFCSKTSIIDSVIFPKTISKIDLEIDGTDQNEW